MINQTGTEAHQEYLDLASRSVVRLIEEAFESNELLEWQVLDLYLTYHLFREGVYV